MPHLPRPCLMVLTDRTLLTPNWTLAQAIAPAVTGGANFVLFREQDLPPVPRTSVIGFVKDGVKGRVPLVALGDPLWASKVGADGVHLEGSPVTVSQAREIVGPAGWVGLTVSSVDELAGAGDADYALIHVDWNEPERALELVKRYSSASSVPLVVGPDVPLEQAGPCVLAGAAGVAVIRAAMSDYDRTGSLQTFARVLGLPAIQG